MDLCYTEQVKIEKKRHDEALKMLHIKYVNNFNTNIEELKKCMSTLENYYRFRLSPYTGDGYTPELNYILMNKKNELCDIITESMIDEITKTSEKLSMLNVGVRLIINNSSTKCKSSIIRNKLKKYIGSRLSIFLWITI